MALQITTSDSRIEGNEWVNESGKRLALTADGRVVEDTDVAAVTLLVGAGGRIPLDRAAELGLFAEEPEAEAEAEEPKARRGSSKEVKDAEDKGE